MKRWLLIGSIALIVSCSVSYVYRSDIRDAWSAWRAPRLPLGVKFELHHPDVLRVEQNSQIEGGSATSEHFVLISSPTPTPPKDDPFADRGALPKEANLDVPFSSQAPTGDWSMPYQEACEETSAMMVDAYYKGKSGTIPAGEAAKTILAVVAYEQKILGYYRDTDVQATAKFIREFFKPTDVIVRPLKNVDEIKRAIANGYPVIVPAAGKLLPNPNFRNGGPLYHMLVVKGYTKDVLITNDPGTRVGANFTYRTQDFLHAAHDWNGGDVMHGAPMMIVVIP